MKLTGTIFLPIVLLLFLPSCGWRKNTMPAKKDTAKKTAMVNMPLITDSRETSKTLAFDEDANSFETMESFILSDDSRFSDLDKDAAVALNDSDNVSFSWEAVQEEARGAFEPIYFGYDNANIAKEERSKVTKNAQEAKKATEKGTVVVCKGKACKWGQRATEMYNLALSDQRAQSTARELKAAGVPAENIKAFGVGTKEAIAVGTTKAEHAKDRCVEMYTLTI